jgi:hypothetical protein
MASSRRAERFDCRASCGQRLHHRSSSRSREIPTPDASAFERDGPSVGSGRLGDRHHPTGLREPVGSASSVLHRGRVGPPCPRQHKGSPSVDVDLRCSRGLSVGVPRLEVHVPRSGR